MAKKFSRPPNKPLVSPKPQVFYRSTSPARRGTGGQMTALERRIKPPQPKRPGRK